MPPKPLCFMIMPYGRKPTQAEAGHGPAEIDFNALWDRAYVPVIEALGYEAVRADQDTRRADHQRDAGAALFRRSRAGRHDDPERERLLRGRDPSRRDRKTGCVLLAADWSKQLFDVAQMRTVRYPLPEGEITSTDRNRVPVRGQGRHSQSRRAANSPMHNVPCRDIRGWCDPQEGVDHARTR